MLIRSPHCSYRLRAVRKISEHFSGHRSSVDRCRFTLIDNMLWDQPLTRKMWIENKKVVSNTTVSTSGLTSRNMYNITDIGLYKWSVIFIRRCSSWNYWQLSNGRKERYNFILICLVAGLFQCLNAASIAHSRACGLRVVKACGYKACICLIIRDPLLIRSAPQYRITTHDTRTHSHSRQTVWLCCWMECLHCHRMQADCCTFCCLHGASGTFKDRLEPV